MTRYYQWAHPLRAHGMATPAELEAAGWRSMGQRDPRYTAVLYWRGETWWERARRWIRGREGG